MSQLVCRTVAWRSFGQQGLFSQLSRVHGRVWATRTLVPNWSELIRLHWAKSRISFVDTCLKFYRHVLKLISLNSLTHLHFLCALAHTPVTVGHQLDGISCTCRIHTKRLSLIEKRRLAIQSGQKDCFHINSNKDCANFKEVSHQILKHAWQLQTSK